MGSTICDISEEAKEEIKKFRFKKDAYNSALVLKVDRDKQAVVVDEFYEDITIEDLKDEVAEHQPRYIIYTYKMIHDDQRVSYPMCFIFYTPRDSQMELQMMYACTKAAIQRIIDSPKCFEIRELDELSEEWLREKLK